MAVDGNGNSSDHRGYSDHVHYYTRCSLWALFGWNGEDKAKRVVGVSWGTSDSAFSRFLGVGRKASAFVRQQNRHQADQCLQYVEVGCEVNAARCLSLDSCVSCFFGIAAVLFALEGVLGAGGIERPARLGGARFV